MSHAVHYLRSAFALHEQLATDTHPIAELDLCALRLMDDVNYPWLILVPRVEDAREITDLTAEQQVTLMREIDRSARLVQAMFRPHKLNVAALGNRVPQLHVHVIARYTDDPAWPAPVWGRVHARSYDPETLVERVKRLREGLLC